MTLKDLSGKHMLATQVFGLSIKALVDHLMDMVERRPNPIKKNEIKWVLTVPAIWTDGAKQFMRKCAESAGILSDRLILALEPEAASIFCQYSTAEEQHRIETGTSYMVVDLGGGTADITVHEKMANGKLKELSRADGSNCGGTSVDDRFFQLLVKILGGQLMKFLRDYNLSAYLSLFREFETVKRTIDSIKTDYVNMVVPCSSLEKLCKKFLGEDFTSAIKSSPLKNDIRLCGDKIRINVDRMMKLVIPTIDDIVALMNDVLQRKKASGVTHIMLVGGFAECRLIQDRVNESFPDKTIIVPREAQLSILKGAVLFGHNPDLVKYRVMRFSYGIETSRTFIDKQDDKKYMKLVDGEKLCHKLFAKLVSKNEDVRCGKKIQREFFTSYANQDEIIFKIYISTDENPCHIDEESCKVIGEMRIKLHNPCRAKRYVDVEAVFGNTEIGITAVDRKTRQKITSSFNLV
ncbi:heat shock 70 kDa protein 12A-like [Mytilus edulis]|uniref:heat shock 70 kDa protein 12A-like n=1 Tax=Mytilus edulis TaxID=6550 RepID=UPI0039EFCBD5